MGLIPINGTFHPRASALAADTPMRRLPRALAVSCRDGINVLVGHSRFDHSFGDYRRNDSWARPQFQGQRLHSGRGGQLGC